MGPNHTINSLLPHSRTFNIYTTISSITTPHANNVHTLNRTSSTSWILNSADEHWKHNKARHFYGYSHTTPTTNPHNGTTTRTRNHKSIQPRTLTQKYQTSHHHHQKSYAGGQQRPINSIQHIYIIDVEILSK
jgi:hypothetical protein